jgi:hypothetical protein
MKLNFSLLSHTNRTDYALQPNGKKDGMHSRTELLNGIPMSIITTTTSNSRINKIDDEEDTVSIPKAHDHGISRTRQEGTYIPPISISFIVVHCTSVRVC